MLRWGLYILLGLIGLVAIVAGVGASLPKGHTATRSITYASSPAVVFAAITDVKKFPEWRSRVTKVEVLADDGRGMLFREDGKDGNITYRIEKSEPGVKLVTRIADSQLAFGGSWTYTLRPVGTGTELTITEDGEVYNPIFRFVSRFFMSPTATIETYLEDLRKRLAASR
jgi:uncharacterized protein YndB with AHSA1/START domain